jgi:hypothetical protein
MNGEEAMRGHLKIQLQHGETEENHENLSQDSQYLG